MSPCSPRTLVLLALVATSIPGFARPAGREDPPSPAAATPAQTPPLPDPAEPPAMAAPEPLPVPAGSKEDQALWKGCRDVANQLASIRWVGNGLHWRIRTEELDARLQAKAKADPGGAAGIEAVRTRLVQAQVASYGDLTSTWPVDKTRVCQYPQSILGSTMAATAAGRPHPQLAQAREAASRCLDLARAVLARVKGSTDALATAVAEAEKALEAVAPAGGAR